LVILKTILSNSIIPLSRTRKPIGKNFNKFPIKGLHTIEMRWAGHVACMGEKFIHGFGVKGRKTRTTKGYRRAIRMDFPETSWHILAGLIWLRAGTSGGH
jgi:hypothetical protein